MPITFTPDNPAGLLGPGLGFKLQTSLIGPLPSTTVWTYALSLPTLEFPVQQGQHRDNRNPTLITLQVAEPATLSFPDASHVYRDGEQVTIETTLQQSGAGAADDNGSAVATWSNTAGLTNIVKRAAGQSGLTADQALQLQQVHDAAVPTISVDATIPVTSLPGPPGGVISGQLPVPVFGLIVNIDQVPAELQPGTPDGLYWTASLAVVRIFRGTSLFMRVPIHTESKIVPLFTDVVTAAVATLTAATWLLNMSYQVSFRAGVVGRVTEMRFP